MKLNDIKKKLSSILAVSALLFTNNLIISSIRIDLAEIDYPIADCSTIYDNRSKIRNAYYSLYDEIYNIPHSPEVREELKKRYHDLLEEEKNLRPSICHNYNDLLIKETFMPWLNIKNQRKYLQDYCKEDYSFLK